MGYHGRRIDDEWLREHYPRATDIHELLDDHEKEFGWRPSKTAAYVKANKMGLHKDCAGFALDLRLICGGFALDLRRVCA